MIKTKCIVLGEESKEEKKLEPIRFIKQNNGNIDRNSMAAGHGPAEWKNIELVCKSENIHYFDIMFAYDDNRTVGTIYFGYWNDGVVEAQPLERYNTK